MFDLGINLRKLRKSRNWTQKRLSELLNISEASISKYESNIAAPPIDTLRAYAVLFKVSMDELLGNQSQGVLSLQGLTDEQKEVICKLAEVFKNPPRNADDIADASYNVMGRIITEMHKLK